MKISKSLVHKSLTNLNPQAKENQGSEEANFFVHEWGVSGTLVSKLELAYHVTESDCILGPKPLAGCSSHPGGANRKQWVTVQTVTHFL